jgi:hypothetical protein
MEIAVSDRDLESYQFPSHQLELPVVLAYTQLIFPKHVA